MQPHLRQVPAARYQGGGRDLQKRAPRLPGLRVPLTAAAPQQKGKDGTPQPGRPLY